MNLTLLFRRIERSLPVLKALLGVRFSHHLGLLLRYPRYYLKFRGYLDVEGWLGYQEAVCLYKTATALPRRRPILVEIGTWLGRSAVVLGKALQQRGDGVLYCVDPFNADGDRQSRRIYEAEVRGLGRPLREACWANIMRHGVQSHVQLIEGYGHQVAAQWSDPIDLLFIDGNHEYDSVRQDFDDWTRFLVPDSVLIMDDVYLDGGGHAGPAQVVRESVLGHAGWRDGKVVGTFYVARKQ